MAERLKAHAWKACWGQPLQGSNPCLSAVFNFIFQLQFVMKNLFALLAIAGLVMFAAPQAVMAQEDAATEMAADMSAESDSAVVDSSAVDSAAVDSAAAPAAVEEPAAPADERSELIDALQRIEGRLEELSRRLPTDS